MARAKKKNKNIFTFTMLATVCQFSNSPGSLVFVAAEKSKPTKMKRNNNKNFIHMEKKMEMKKLNTKKKQKKNYTYGHNC